MMGTSVITGIGVDIEEIDRFNDMHADDPTLQKIFAKNEIAYCFAQEHPAQHLAGRFAAKEACIKALHAAGRTDVSSLDASKIRIERNAQGQPIIVSDLVDARHLRALISLSHSHQQAIAFVILQTI